VIRNRLVTKLILALLVLVCGKSSAYASATETSDVDSCTVLAAFSFDAAQRACLSGASDRPDVALLGGITKVWGILLDDKGDLIIVGERDASRLPLLLDDAVVALRTRQSIDKYGESPGVSIEPPRPGRYSNYQMVKYFGGVEDYHYGTVCFEADLLLKKLGMGYELSGIDGFPSEYDLMIDNSRAGRSSNPWAGTMGRSWFFPQRIRLMKGHRALTVASVQMRVRTNTERELEIPAEYIDLHSQEMAQILEYRPDAVSLVHARLISQNYDELAKHHPVLNQLRSLLVLSGLMAQAVGRAVPSNLEYWISQYPVAIVQNPDSIPTLSRADNGEAFSAGVSGGICGVYTVEDAYTDAALSRKPKFLRMMVLDARPESDDVTWAVPIHLGNPADWEEDQEQEFATSHKYPNDAGLTSGDTFSRQGEMSVDQSGEWSRMPQIATTPGWHPETEGTHLVHFSGRLHLSTGGHEQYLIGQRFTSTSASIEFGIPMSLSWTFRNTVSLDLTVPFEFQMEFSDHLRMQGWIPTNDHVIIYRLGIDNPTLTNRIRLVSGISEGRWRLPWVSLENTLYFPTSDRFMADFVSGEEHHSQYPLEFGSDQWKGSFSLTATHPTSDRFRLSSWLGRTIQEGNVNWTRIGFGITTVMDPSNGTSFGLMFQDERVSTHDIAGSPYSDGYYIMASLSFPAKLGSNSFQIGWYQADKSDDGTFLMSIDFSGTALWDRRFWF